jgi:hypothetical protein
MASNRAPGLNRNLLLHSGKKIDQGLLASNTEGKKLQNSLEFKVAGFDKINKNRINPWKTQKGRRGKTHCCKASDI